MSKLFTLFRFVGVVSGTCWSLALAVGITLCTRRKAGVRPRPCPSCGASLGGHEKEDLAGADFGTEDDKRLAGLIAKGAWSEARAYQDVHGLEDIRCWFIIRCEDGRVGVVAQVMTNDFWSDGFYGEPRWLSGDEAEALAATRRNARGARQYLPDPDPDVEPGPSDFNERVLKSVHARRRREAWRDAILIAGIVLVCVVAVLVLRR